MRYSTRTEQKVTSAASLRRRPGQLVVLGFLAAIAAGTALLSLPVASTDRNASFVEALFTATSAVCVTGLIVTDTPVFWTTFGHVVILVLIQVGGLGVMAVASTLGLLLSRRLDLSTRLVAAASTRAVGLGDLRAVLLGAICISLVIEAVTALALAARFAVGYGEPPGRALWLGVFHAVSAFNNAGFALFSDSLISLGTDPWICVPLCAAVVLGGIGFPVIMELLRQHRRPSRWSLHTKITLWMTTALVLVGTPFFLATEWGNPATLGPMDLPGKLLSAFTQSVMARTAGFNSLDTSQMNTETWLDTDVLMFIGAGSAGTAGGIKVTTFAILAIVIWSELRGDPDASVFDRRISLATQRQALTVALLGVAIVIVPTLYITTSSPYTSDEVLFEVVSAFSTTGLSTGITAGLEWYHQLILVVLMFIGRLGPITLGTSLALRNRSRFYRLPESAPIIG